VQHGKTTSNFQRERNIAIFVKLAELKPGIGELIAALVTLQSLKIIAM
jgi:hypothetical protein